jgi:predicted RNA-binding protein with RPS1 domain
VNPETEPQNLEAKLEHWAENPPPSLSAALREDGIDVEALEEHARSGISTEQAELLRRVLVQGAGSGEPEDAALLARLTPLLDPRARAWDRLMRAKQSGEVLTATVTEATRGGVVVDMGVRGFVPASQIGLSVPRNLEQFVGRELRLRVLEIDRRRQTVVLTNRQVAEEERASRRKGAIERITEGETRAGVVRRLTEIGAFVDVGGVDGLLHVSEISWKRIEHPSDVLKVGQKVQVKVLRVDPQAGRISLSMRRLMVDPLEEARRKYQVGATVKVKIGSTVQQGAIVDLDEQGVDGFIPISELAPRRINSPDEVVQPGQEVDAAVIDFRPRERRVVFSLRKLEQQRDRHEVESYQRKTRRTSDRTTLGDLFGHLFEEFQATEDEEEAKAGTADQAGDKPEASAGEAAPEPPAERAKAAAPEEAVSEPPETAGAAEDAEAGAAEAPAAADEAGETRVAAAPEVEAAEAAEVEPAPEARADDGAGTPDGAEAVEGATRQEEAAVEEEPARS